MNMTITNKHIMEELKLIGKNLPKTDIYISAMNNKFKDIHYNQDIMKSDMKEMIIACNDRNFGCGFK
jgi:hypothetical protein